MEQDRIAILAGDGILPDILASRLADKGLLSLVVVLQGTKERFSSLQEITYKIALGRVKEIRSLLIRNRIDKVIMIGKIDKDGLLGRDDFDMEAIQLLNKTKDLRDLTIFHIILDEFKKIGIEVLNQDKYLSDMIVNDGILTKRKPTKREMSDALFGLDYARRLATMEIGQTVVVKNQMIIAVEAVEGTNQTIIRGADLIKNGTIVCKAARANQDRRFDIPTVGLETIKVMARKGCTLLALEAKKILMVNIERVIDFANMKKISIIGI